MKKSLVISSILFALTLIHQVVFASSTGHGGGIPWGTVTAQVFNVVVLLIGLVYFLAKPIRSHFQARQKDFLSVAEKAKATLKEAERSHLELTHKLEKLQSTADESVAKAELEAKAVKAGLLEEAKSLSQRIQNEARLAAEAELKRAKHELRIELLKVSINSTQEKLANSSIVTTEDHARLQNEFVTELSREGRA